MTTAGPSGGRGGDPTSRAAVLAAAIALLGFGPATAQEAGGERGNATGGNPAAAQAADRELPPVNALVPNFYYEDLAAAREFYVEKLGLPVVVDIGWVVIVEIAPGRQLALVDGERGTLSPTPEKGALLVIETDALEEWYAYVSAIEGIDWYQYGLDFRQGVELKHGIMDHGTIEEFRILDPEGYIIEFFRWKEGARP